MSSGGPTVYRGGSTNTGIGQAECDNGLMTRPLGNRKPSELVWHTASFQAHFEQAFETRLRQQFQGVRQSVSANITNRTTATSAMELGTASDGFNLFCSKDDFTCRSN